MSLEETKQLLRSFRISPNKILGQNFMVEPAIYPKLLAYASIKPSDVVLDAGAGFGWLTCFLSSQCKAVIAVEKDPIVAKVLSEQVKSLNNVTIIEGDVLKANLPKFNKVISIPPYYLSSNLVTWLFDRHVDCAVIILQKEFADRLVAKTSSENYGWLTVLTYQKAEADLLDTVPKELFFPSPKVDSVVLRLKPHRVKAFEVKNEAVFLRLVKWLFTQRNKKISKAIVPFLKSNFKLSKAQAEEIATKLPFQDRRSREITPVNFGELANALPN